MGSLSSLLTAALKTFLSKTLSWLVIRQQAPWAGSIVNCTVAWATAWLLLGWVSLFLLELLELTHYVGSWDATAGGSALVLREAIRTAASTLLTLPYMLTKVANRVLYKLLFVDLIRLTAGELPWRTCMSYTILACLSMTSNH